MKFRDEYLKTGGIFCPFCKSDDIEGSAVDIVGSEAVQEVSCVRCNGAWRDTYRLHAVETLDEPSK